MTNISYWLCVVYIDFKSTFEIVAIGKYNYLYFDYTILEENYLVFPALENDKYYLFNLSQV